jgi:putative adenylate-forming enzyme
VVRTLVTIACAKNRFRAYSPGQIRGYQLERAGAIVRYAKEHSPFFRKLYHGLDSSDFASLPFVDKRRMMEDIGSYATIGATTAEIMAFCLEVEKSRDFSRRLGGHTVALSTGTSGSRGVEIVSPREESFFRAMFLARFPFPPGLGLNIAFILRVSSPALQLRAFGHRLTYVSQLGVLENIVEKLNGIAPNVIAGPPSVLRLLAEERRRGSLRISPVLAVSYGEVLYDDVKADLAAAFGGRVLEIYKCSEGAIAVSCAAGRLHLNEDLVLVELFDERGGPVPAGTPCDRMVITDLHRRAQPIIRYQLNDVVTLSAEPCPCGSRFRVIARIQGRRDEMFWLPRAQNRPGGQFVYPDFITRAIVSAGEPGSVSDAIREYVAVQESPDRVVVYLEMRGGPPGEGHAGSIRRNLANLFGAFDCSVPRIDIEKGIPPALSGRAKHSRIVRRFPAGEVPR